eukprot:scaffold4116_cov338-Prasinococcus_capsulatus_cf.AAC.3
MAPALHHAKPRRDSARTPPEVGVGWTGATQPDRRGHIPTHAAQTHSKGRRGGAARAAAAAAADRGAPRRPLHAARRPLVTRDMSSSHVIAIAATDKASASSSG